MVDFDGVAVLKMMHLQLHMTGYRLLHSECAQTTVGRHTQSMGGSGDRGWRRRGGGGGGGAGECTSPSAHDISIISDSQGGVSRYQQKTYTESRFIHLQDTYRLRLRLARAFALGIPPQIQTPLSKGCCKMHAHRRLKPSLSCATRLFRAQVLASLRAAAPRTRFLPAQPHPPPRFDPILKFLNINTKLTDVDFGFGGAVSLRLLSPSSDLMTFTERDVDASPLRGNLPFWAFLWPGGYAITRWILHESSRVKGHVVVDIGSGCGSAAICARLQGAAAVIANDTDAFACMALAHNSRCNGASGITTCSADLLPTLPIPCLASAAITRLDQLIALCSPIAYSAPRLLLLGDMLYDHDLGARALALADAAVARGWRVATGDPGRCIAVSQSARLGQRVATYDLTQELRANNHGMTSASVYVAGGNAE
jgi:predicted nicotinamide N-methyase